MFENPFSGRENGLGEDQYLPIIIYVAWKVLESSEGQQVVFNHRPGHHE